MPRPPRYTAAEAAALGAPPVAAAKLRRTRKRQPPPAVVTAPQLGLDGSVAITVVGLLPPGLNGHDGIIRMTARQYAATRNAWSLALASVRSGMVAPVPCRVVMERRHRGQRLDIDNRYASIKIPLDALRHAGWLPDDNPDIVVDFAVVEVAAARGERIATTITIIPVRP